MEFQRVENHTKHFIALLSDWADRRTIFVVLMLSLVFPLAMLVSRHLCDMGGWPDLFIPIDAAWRYDQGQLPHVDFYSPIGLFYFWLHGTAARIGGMDARLIIWAQLLALPIVLIPALLVAIRRLHVLALVLFIPFIVLLVVSPTALGENSNAIGHLATYNRISWASCCVVCVWALLPPRRPGLSWTVIEAALIGVLLATQFYTKVTYFAFSIGLVGLGMLLHLRRLPLAILVVGVVALSCVLLEAAHPGLHAAYLADLRRVGAVAPLLRAAFVKGAVNTNLSNLAIFAVLIATLFWLDRLRWPIIAAVATAAVVSIMVASQNHEVFDPPLVVLVLLLAQQCLEALQAERSDTPAPSWLLVGAAAMAVTTASPFVLAQANGVRIHWNLARTDDGFRPDGGLSPTLRTMRWFSPGGMAYYPVDFSPEIARQWKVKVSPASLAKINADGFAALAELDVRGRKIAVLDNTNPFAAGLQQPSMKGGALWWDLERTFAQGELSPDNVIGDADIVMAPKFAPQHNEDTVDALVAAAHPKLDRDFIRRDTLYWVIWLRRT